MATPWTDWAFPADEQAERVRSCFALYLAAAIDGQGEVWTTEDHACVAMWQGPVTKALSDTTSSDAESRRLRARTATLLGENAERVAAANAAVDAHRPPWPHWFLGSVGTRPEFRRRGLARAVLAPVLRRCDQDAVEAVLDIDAQQRRDGFPDDRRAASRARGSQGLGHGPQAAQSEITCLTGRKITPWWPRR